jgi:uncharacterized protein with GYD domain
MLIFILLGRLTGLALDQVKGFEERDKKAAEIISKAGGKLLSLHYTFGQYDFIAIIEAPTQEAMTMILMEIGRFGTVCSETLLAMKPEQLYSVIEKVKWREKYLFMVIPDSLLPSLWKALILWSGSLPIP